MSSPDGGGSFTQASDFPPEVLSLFDKYVHNVIDRRGFLEGAAKFAVGGITAASFLEALSPRFAEAQQVAKTDGRIEAKYVEFPSPHGYGKGRGYLVVPVSAAKAATKLPAILVAHENRGLNPHIEDIARRLALEGFAAFAPDALFALGGYPGDEDKARDLFTKLDQTKTREDFVGGPGSARATVPLVCLRLLPWGPQAGSRPLSLARLRTSWFEKAGFEGLSVVVAEQLQTSRCLEDAVREGMLERSFTSQLTALAPVDYLAGLKKIRRAAEKNAAFRAEVDLTLYATEACKPPE